MLQPRMFLDLLARLLLRLVGRGPLLPLSLVGRGPFLSPFPVGGGSLMLLFPDGRGQGPFLLYSGGLGF